MAMNNTSVDSYLADGCGRCDKFQTPACKVHQYPKALSALRTIVLESGLTETMKWGSPCYMLDDKNVVMIGTYKDCCFISYLRGALLNDVDHVLQLVGPNTRSARLFKFTSEEEVLANAALIAKFLDDCIGFVKAGTKVPPRTSTEPMPEELQDMLDENPDVADAYEALTPGRQRSYILHVSGAKQSKTRVSRADKSIEKIMLGKGFNER
jgi:uncharacterized protein YdeI (YjbR/CyaY-like superfamily)